MQNVHIKTAFSHLTLVPTKLFHWYITCNLIMLLYTHVTS